jgi:flagellar basal-body rod protein FlgB
MAVSDIPIFSILRTKMHWHQERQRLLAENVANADTPRFRPRDLVPLKLDNRQPVAMANLALAVTAPSHLSGSAADSPARFQTARVAGYETSPAGNAVNLEEQMLKVAANQMDYQTVTSLYTRSLGLLKTALGRR